ncbi:hypothetical protein CEUSTIGMA_g2500.t1 [Chlamydomonas eustigma]|uniref:Uncharacterized protein n=1 Tax=Chlamydomonas eustigma TaxID=1157962 RepID=A0A250WWB5_9CHLO|nr:hypothetical protein CEUSTIGMA_g2500.t1 [Chlamydomonas eustigma]|eukprot:GAX75056.1 hypothetical protein CEUSTIGMA_g2500.t1 [Chlamydomonas eustigma]
MDAKDVELWANTKYQQPWSAQVALSQLDHAKLSLILQVFSNGKLDQLVKVRLLLSCCLLPPHRKTELSALLTSLAEVARSDEDEFVRVIGHAVGDFSGQLDLEAVMRLLPMVSETMSAVWDLLESAKPQAGFIPLQDVYMHPDIKSQQEESLSVTKQQKHFQLREASQTPLPDFSIDTLFGGGSLESALGDHAKVASVKDKPGPVARRGSGLSTGTGLWIKKGPFQRPSLNSPLSGSVSTTPDPASSPAGLADSPLPNKHQSSGSALLQRMRSSKPLPMPVGMAASSPHVLQRSSSIQSGAQQEAGVPDSLDVKSRLSYDTTSQTVTAVLPSPLHGDMNLFLQDHAEHAMEASTYGTDLDAAAGESWKDQRVLGLTQQDEQERREGVDAKGSLKRSREETLDAEIQEVI